ncbi:MAG TPA: DUF3604 domain-containing protein [Rhabdochlamydiaceae bacterium]|nr:DUF3604 domain-containing protein [Rhabdochlamydiaceae bacterium]
MRRSICFCEPNSALAGEISTWRFSYSTATNLPKGTRLKFDLLTKGRENIDWTIPRVNFKEKKNVIWLEIPGGKTVAAKELEVEDSFAPVYEFVLPVEVKAGETITILIGTPEKNREEIRKKGTRAQTNVQRRRPFHLFIDPKGKGDYKEPEIFTLDVRGNLLHTIRIIAPSVVSKNKRFDVIVRFEDCFGNLTSNAPEGTLIELSYEHLRENLTWKLFVPETGFINLPNLYFNEPGVYKIQLRNLKTNDKFYSAPIKCFPDYDKSIYWGLLHGESERVDSTENIESCLRHFRDEKSMQFFASSCFESIEETSNEIWKAVSLQIAEFNEEGRFVTFLGFQWFNNAPEEGLRHLIYMKDNKPILRKKDAKTNTLKKIYKGHHPKEILSVPSFTMAKGFTTTFDDFSPDYERVVEIYNAWGSSECTAKEGNQRPISASSKGGIQETEKGSIRNALNRNCRFGFVAGGLDDRGIYSDCYESDQVQYSPGLTAIIAIEQSREALMLALYNRACYATTGERIILGFAIAGAQMGSELNTKAKPGLVLNRHITGYVAGTAPIKEISIIRNGSVLKTFQHSDPFIDFAYDDTEHLSKAVLASADDRPYFAYYYMRVVQEDGHIGWTSPIWIDYPEINLSLQPKKSKKKV